MNFLYFVGGFLLFSTLSGATDPQLCDATSLDYQYLDSDYSINITVNLVVTIANKQNQVIASNFTTSIVNLKTNQRITNVTICADTAGSQKPCLSDITSNLTSIFTDGTLELWISILGKDDMPFYYTLVDEGSFAFYIGQLYDDRKCIIAENNEIGFTATECCTNFKPVIPKPDITPACNLLSSTTKILNNDSSTYATINAVHSWDNDNFMVTGSFNGSKDYQPIFNINGWYFCQVAPNNTFTCNIPISDKFKLLLFISEYSGVTDMPATLFSRIILRDGQTWMAEGDPFTFQKRCQDLNLPYRTFQTDNRTVESTVCCLDYQSDAGGSTLSTVGYTTSIGGYSGGSTTDHSNNSNVVRSLWSLLILGFILFL